MNGSRRGRSPRLIGLTHDEIAGKLGRNPGAVRTLLSRALARLAEALAGS